jgi:hypothetical protein
MASDYFLDVARCCFANGRVQLGPELPEFVLQMVDRISFIRCAAIVHKRDPMRDVARAMAAGEPYLASQGAQPEMQANYAEWICAHDGPNDRAEAAVVAALAGAPTSARNRLLKAETLLRAGENESAGAILKEVAATRQKHHPLLLHLAALQLRVGDSAAARSTYEAAQAVGPMSFQIRRGWDGLMGRSKEGQGSALDPLGP